MPDEDTLIRLSLNEREDHRKSISCNKFKLVIYKLEIFSNLVPNKMGDWNEGVWVLNEVKVVLIERFSY